MKTRKNITLDSASLGILERGASACNQSHSAYIRQLLYGSRECPKVTFQGGVEVSFESGDKRVVVMQVRDRGGFGAASFPEEVYEGSEYEDEFASLDRVVTVYFNRELRGYCLTNAVVVSALGCMRSASVNGGTMMHSLIGDGDLVIAESEFPMPTGKQHGVVSVLRYNDGKIELITYMGSSVAKGLA